MAKRSTRKTNEGEKVILALLRKIGSQSLTKLSKELGITNQAIQIWKKRSRITPLQIAGLVHKAQGAARRDTHATSIRPIVEFFPVTRCPSQQEKSTKSSQYETKKRSLIHIYLA